MVHPLLAFALYETKPQSKPVEAEASAVLRARQPSSRAPLRSVSLKDGQLPRISIEELRRHNVPASLWVAIEGKVSTRIQSIHVEFSAYSNFQVYDLTTFLPRHPGGGQILLAAAGRDATTHFIHTHGPKERATLKKFMIGELDGHDLPVYPEPDHFSKTVRAVSV
jgi:cytochrome b involved in lipid metabolism